MRVGSPFPSFNLVKKSRICNQVWSGAGLQHRRAAAIAQYTWLMDALGELEKRVTEAAEGAARAAALAELAFGLMERDPARGAAVAREALESARAANDAPGEAKALLALGSNLYSQADSAGVFETQREALALFRAHGERRGEARSLNLLGSMHLRLAEYGLALARYEEALERFREIDDRRAQARVFANIGNVELRLGNIATALELFDQALVLRREVNDSEGAGFDLNNSAFAHVTVARKHAAAGQADDARAAGARAVERLERALEIARDQGFRRLEVHAMQTMVEAYQAMARPHEALGLAAEVLARARESADSWIEAYALAQLGDLRAETGASEEGADLLEQAIASFASLQARDEVARVRRLLARVREGQGRAAEALASLKEAYALEQDLKDEETERRSRALSARRRLQQAEAEIARMRELALRDALTGLANRREFDVRLEAALADAAASGRPVALAMADIDHFKQVNDRFSHTTGDEVLRLVGSILRAHCRREDVAARFGGEEFALILPGADRATAIDACERCRRAIEGQDWTAIHPGLGVTISFGIAWSKGALDVTALVTDADRNLYASKHGGRNRVTPSAAVQ